MLDSYNISDSDIAVVGMACHFPDAKSYSEFWDNLTAGKESVTFFSEEELIKAGIDKEEIRNPNYVKAGVTLQDVKMFDAGFFGLSPKEASIMDPQHRHFLEAAWEALEDSGYVPEKFNGPIGIFGGCGMNSYFMFNILTNPDLVKSTGLFLLRHTGNDKDFLPTRVSYNFNLTGPSVTIQTACSTSLVAIHAAVQSLLSGECDMALAGGVTIELPQIKGYLFQEGEILSSDGKCRPFDSKSNGTIFGSGVGIVVLRRLEDAINDRDNIHAVIKSTAINNDGSNKVGYFAPSVEGQSKVIAEALALANVKPESISYIEAHGTGTFIGDPIELAALNSAFKRFTKKINFCGIGSVKGNIGHLDTAAGVAGFIKTVLSLKNKKIPANINFEKPNPNLDIAESPFYINDKLTDWKENGYPLRAGVSSLGVGGTNAHIILQEAPNLESFNNAKPWYLLVWSARTATSLNKVTDKYIKHFSENNSQSIEDVSFTLKNGRKEFTHRQFVVCQNIAEASEILKSKDNKRYFNGSFEGLNPSIIFMFSGGGAQYPNMSKDLYNIDKTYKENIDYCLDYLFSRYSIDIRSLLFPELDKLDDAHLELQKPLNSVLSIFIVEIALAKFWISRGIKPEALIGHSLGEYAAACISGVMSLEDTLSLVVLRGKIFEKMPPGGMLSVNLSQKEIAKYLNNSLSVGVVNGSDLLVLSGTISAIEDVEKQLVSDGIDCKRIKIDVAAHSKMLEPFLEEFRNGLSEVKLKVPLIPFVSNLSGNWIKDEEAKSIDYWVKQLRHSVKFYEGINTLLNERAKVFLEIGPGNTLSSLVRSHDNYNREYSVVSSLRHPNENISDYKYYLISLGRLWLAGTKIKWELFNSENSGYRVSLPTYAFDKQSYWIEPGQFTHSSSNKSNPLEKIKNVEDWFSKPVWIKEQLKVDSNKINSLEVNYCLILNDNEGLGLLLSRKLESIGQKTILVYLGDEFNQLNENEFTVRVDRKEDYLNLIRTLSAKKITLSKIIHLWGVRSLNESDLNQLELNSHYLFYSFIYLAQSLGEYDVQDELKWITVTNGMHNIENDNSSYPLKALALGPIKTIPQEFPKIKSISLDIDNSFDKLEASENIISELYSDFTEQEIAIRGNHRFIKSFEKMTLKSDNGKDLIIDSGVYIITGGLGGIALNIAKDLAKHDNLRLIFISRTLLPDKTEWENYITSHSTLDSNSTKIKKLIEIENEGAEVTYFSADVSNSMEIEKVFQVVNDKYGHINGVIHTAGAIDDGVIMFKKKDDASSVLAPKVKGTIILAELSKKYGVEFLIMFSSVSSILVSTGQVDYAAANSFIDAYANSNFDNKFKTIAINWGQWQQVGMAARIAKSLGIVKESFRVEELTHPFLGTKLISDSGKIEYHNKISGSKFWMLREHKDINGNYIMPGTGYLELVISAITDIFNERTFKLTDIFFLHPIILAEGEQKDIKIIISNKSSDIYDFQILTGSDSSEADFFENVRGSFSVLESELNLKKDISQIINRCSNNFPIENNSIRHYHMNFGPRWNNINEIIYNNNEALISLELSPEFIDDLNYYKLHPALFDFATGGAQFLTGADLKNDFYLPFSYSAITVNRALPDQFYSHVIYKSDNSKIDKSISFDISIYDIDGNMIIKIENFTMIKSSENRNFLNNPERPNLHREFLVEGSHNPINPKVTSNKILDIGQKEGILPQEGIIAFNTILNDMNLPQYIVLSQNLEELGKFLSDNKQKNVENVTSQAQGESSRPNLTTDYLAPRNEVESGIAEIWQQILGIDNIGINDDFLELGGHSLLLTRVVMKVRKKFSVDLSLNNLFEVPTISTFATEVQKALDGAGNEKASVISTVSRDNYRVN